MNELDCRLIVIEDVDCTYADDMANDVNTFEFIPSIVILQLSISPSSM